MKKTLAGTIIVLVLSALINTGSTYPQTVRVMETTPDKMTVETSAGLLYDVLAAPEDICVGDMLSVIMNDCGTPDDVTDDKVVEYRYCGF